MSDLVIAQPEGMDDARWNATKGWLAGWLEDTSPFFHTPWTWSVCSHELFKFNCIDCGGGE